MEIRKNRLPNGILKPLLILIIIAAGLFLLLQFSSLKPLEETEENKSLNRKYNILVVGKNSSAAYLNQIFLGAKEEAYYRDAAISLYTSPSETQETSMQTLFNYASFLDADGIIAYIESNEEYFSVPENLRGEPIPLVTTGTYLPNIRQLSYIGINYSELGRITAREIIFLAGNSKKAVMLDSNLNNNPNYSTTMNSLLNTLKKESDITLKSISLPTTTAFSKEDFFRQQIASEEDIDLVVCITEEDTILAVQCALDLNLAGNLRILGFGESEECLSYYEKNIITELITSKSHVIGSMAVSELFEYLNNSYANSYVNAEISVLKKGGAK